MLGIASTTRDTHTSLIISRGQTCIQYMHWPSALSQSNNPADRHSMKQGSSTPASTDIYRHIPKVLRKRRRVTSTIQHLRILRTAICWQTVIFYSPNHCPALCRLIKDHPVECDNKQGGLLVTVYLRI